MNKIQFILMLLLMPFIINAGENLSVNKIFQNDDINRVLKGEIITRMYLKNNAVGENTDLKIEVPKTKYDDEDFSIYEMITDEKAFFPYKINSESDKIEFANVLLGFSKLKGMQYFSRRIQKVQQLILDSYRIESPKKKKKIEDLHITSLKNHYVNYFVQKDNKFGKLTFESNLISEGNNFILINTCIEPIALIIPVAKKNEFKSISYFIYDEENKGFFYYSAQVMRIRVEMVLKKGSIKTLYPTTFSNRLRGATVHFAKLLGLNWNDKINPWDEDMLQDGKYKNY